MNDDTLGRDKGVSLHRRIAAELAQRVSGGVLKPGEKLPSERQIARQYNASRATVRTALGHLERQGIIDRRERRSAVVAMRRDITPYLRIGCGSSRLLTLFEQLGHTQLGLPARCQLQLFDLDQPGTIGQVTSQPATGADLLICELEHIRCFDDRPQYRRPLPGQLLSDADVAPAVRAACTDDKSRCFAVPLGISPMVLYYNVNMLGGTVDMSVDWRQWGDLADAAKALTGRGDYALQFRPTLPHLTALLACRGLQLFGPDGRVSPSGPVGLEQVLRSIHDLVHVHRSTPLLGRADGINLFADGRCAMAIDGFDMYGLYADRLGAELGVRSLPMTSSAPGCAGFALVAMAGAESTQPVEDLARLLLGGAVQKVFMDNRAGISVRRQSWNVESLIESGLPRKHAQVFAGELERWQGANLPGSQEHKRAVEKLLLELWLGLDDIDSICSRFTKL